MILVLNAGSSSLKFRVFDENLATISGGTVEEISDESCTQELVFKGKKTKTETMLRNHAEALKFILSFLLENNLRDIKSVGHRVVHGGEKFRSPTIIDSSVLETLKQISNLAPLHLPANITCIESALDL